MDRIDGLVSSEGPNATAFPARSVASCQSIHRPAQASSTCVLVPWTPLTWEKMILTWTCCTSMTTPTTRVTSMPGSNAGVEPRMLGISRDLHGGDRRACVRLSACVCARSDPCRARARVCVCACVESVVWASGARAGRVECVHALRAREPWSVGRAECASGVRRERGVAHECTHV